MRILISGGAGFLGSLVTEQVAGAGHEAVVLDRFCLLAPEKFESMYAPLKGNVRAIQGDIRRLQSVSDALNGIDRIIHLAMLGTEDFSELGEDTVWDVNVEATRELAVVASRSGVSRFVLVTDAPGHGEKPLEMSHRKAEESVRALADTGMEVLIFQCGPLFGVSRRMRFDLPAHRYVLEALAKGSGPDEMAAEIAKMGILPVSFVAEAIADTAISADNSSGNLTTPRQLQPDKDLPPSEISLASLSNHRILQTLQELTAELTRNRWRPDDPAYHNRLMWKQLRGVAAREGGEPVAPRFIPLARPCLDETEEQAVLETIRSGWMTSGPHISAFERQFSETVRSQGAVALISCTAAIHASLVHAGIKPGDTVATTPITWASTGNTLYQMGVKPWFVDIEPHTLNLDPVRLEEALKAGAKAVIPVHMAGHPCRIGEIRALADRYGVPVIEDAAHALGAFYKGVPIGAQGTYVCFSFYAIKNITTIEGGMIATDRQEVAAELKKMAANGMSATAWDRYGRSAVPGPAVVTGPGFKYAMGNVSAAMGVCQLKKLAQFQQKRREVASRYLEKLSGVDEIILPREEPYARSAWHLFIIRLRLDRLQVGRDQFCDDLRHENVGTGIHFYGMHLHPWFREQFGDWRDRLPEATAASEEVLSLPLWPGITDRQVEAVVDAIKKVAAYRRRIKG